MDGGAPEGGYGACPVMWPCRYMDYRWVSPTFWAWRYSKFLFAVPQVAGDLLLRQTAIMLPLRTLFCPEDAVTGVPASCRCSRQCCAAGQAARCQQPHCFPDGKKSGRGVVYPPMLPVR